MIVHDVQQGTEEWKSLRLGIPTASELDNLITDAGMPRKGEMPRTYRAVKLAERWTGAPLQSFGGGVIEQGKIGEAEAVSRYEFDHDCKVERAGFITTDDKRFGCSPDGVVSNAYGLEIKCPQPVNHIKWLLAGGVPDEHILQCHGGMYATGMDRWRFVSYCPGFPMLVADVARDGDMIDAISEALEAFHEQLEQDYARLIELRGSKKEEGDEEHQF